MAQTTEIASRISGKLRYDRLMIEELFEIDEEWDTLADGERASWSLDWDQVIIGHLRELDHYYRAGEMTDEQAARYRDLLQRLRDGQPLIEHLHITPPLVSLEP